MHAIVGRYDAWLASTPSVPKLLLAFEQPEGLHPSPTGSSATIQWARDNVAGLEVATLGPAGHHAPEDLPNEIGDAIASWLDRRQLTTGR